MKGKRAAIRVTRAWWSEWPRLDAATKDRMVADGLVIFE